MTYIVAFIKYKKSLKKFAVSVMHFNKNDMTFHFVVCQLYGVIKKNSVILLMDYNDIILRNNNLNNLSES